MSSAYINDPIGSVSVAMSVVSCVRSAVVSANSEPAASKVLSSKEEEERSVAYVSS